MAEDKLSEVLKGVRLQIFCYILQQKNPVGVREIQRALRLKSASHAAYHLQALYDEGILLKTPQNTYLLEDRYRVNSIKINVLTEYFLFAGRFWPRTVFFASFLFFSLVISFILVLSNQKAIVLTYLVLSTVASLVIATIESIRQIQALPWESQN